MFTPIDEAPLAYLVIFSIVLISAYAFANRSFFDNWRMHPYAIFRGQRLHTPFTSLFVHVGIIHLSVNTALLCFILPDVEYMLIDDFGALYGSLLLLACTVFFAAVSAGFSAIRHRADAAYHSAGASALLSASIVFLLLYFPIVPFDGMPGWLPVILPIWIAVILFAVLVVLALFRVPASAIHLYGAFAGLLFALLVRPTAIDEIVTSFTPSCMLEKGDDETARHDHAGNHAEDGAAGIRTFATLAALDVVRPIGGQPVHPLGDDQHAMFLNFDTHNSDSFYPPFIEWMSEGYNNNCKYLKTNVLYYHW